MRVWTIGHGTRPVAELLECLHEAGVETLVDVRRYPGSRRNPQFGRDSLARSLDDAGIAYRHAVELGGRLAGEPGAERFRCIRSEAFRSYAARMGTEAWQRALETELAQTAPCFMCAETLWWRCHRSLLSDLLVARGDSVVHVIRPGEARPHRLGKEAEARAGALYLCGELVA